MSINTKTGEISAPKVSFKFSGREKKLQIKVEWWSAREKKLQIKVEWWSPLIDASRVGRRSIFEQIYISFTNHNETKRNLKPEE